MTVENSLDIVIVGAGLGGLAAAYRSAQVGHKVQLFEARSSLGPRGGGIKVRPNASRFLLDWGLQQDIEAISNIAVCTNYRNGVTGDVLLRTEPRTAASGYADFGTLRDEAQQMFLRRANEAGAHIAFGVSVVSVSESDQGATVHLGSGPSPGPQLGTAILHQVLLDESDLLTDPDTKCLVSSTDLNVFTATDGAGYVVCKFQPWTRRYNVLFGVPDTQTSNVRLWEETRHLDTVRQHFRDWNPALKAVLGMVKSCNRWRVTQMPELASWASQGGRLFLLGDSAHAMFPDAAQGFSQTIEDIAALSYLLKHTSFGLPRISAFARANSLAFQGGFEAQRVKAKVPDPAQQVDLNDIEPDRDADFADPAFLKWVFSYDAVEEVQLYIAELHSSWLLMP
ncbi:Putative FAD-binding domain, FAD/NAD(P)-binding domain superfamily [Septoria linicola]|uniref:FAD-binding domain, FAD/NAD(P)-binding domain superfamily n=1 Tax=Septoria linicola TaxID=215465 RepID=A0A9Q9EIQ8_9PEZI|nr:Putative FAD-binding domain, FAD/NAD(P)-binding domain superfamily [Septoria linicola]